MKNAVEERASDIHIESYENILRIRYRIDGKLHTIIYFASRYPSSLSYTY
ncbi:ATPase, T2SS/T4P/T4SS family (plasmid) [Clostridium perfringens]